MRAALGAAACYAALTPWVLRPWFLAADALPRVGGDPFAAADLSLNVWILAWIAHALSTDPARLFDGNVYFPASGAIVGSENMLGHAPVTVPALWATGNALVVLKAMVLESFVLAGVAMFLLVRRHTGSTTAALVAGAAYTFTPWRVHSLPQPQYLGSAGLPLALLAVDAWIDHGRPRAIAGLAAALALQGLSCVYLGYFAFAGVPIYALARIAGADGVPRGRRLAGMALGAAAGGAALLPMMWPYLRARANGLIPSHDAATIQRFSATLATVAGPEVFTWMGLVAPALALVAVVLQRRGRRRGDGALWVLVAAGIVLAFGPRLMLWQHAIPLPAAVLYAFAPGFGSIRAPVRFLLVTSVGLAALAGRGFARATADWPAALRAVAAGVLIGLAVGWAAPSGSATTPAQLGAATPPVYRWLAAQPPGAVLELPAAQLEVDFVGNLRNAAYMVASTTHWHPIVNGYTAYPPATDAILLAAVRRLPTADALQRLVDLADVRWVVLHRAALGPWERPPWDAPPPAGLESVARFGDDEVFAVTRPSAQPLRDALLREAEHPSGRTLEGAPTGPLPPECRRARIVSVDAPPTMVPSLAPIPIGVRIENASACPWPAAGVRADGLVMWRYRWTVPSGASYDGLAPTRLLHDVAPGEIRADTVMVQPGGGELGRWTLDLLLMQDGVAEPLATTARHVTLQEWPRGK